MRPASCPTLTGHWTADDSTGRRRRSCLTQSGPTTSHTFSREIYELGLPVSNAEIGPFQWKPPTLGILTIWMEVPPMYLFGSVMRVLTLKAAAVESRGGPTYPLRPRPTSTDWAWESRTCSITRWLCSTTRHIVRPTQGRCEWSGPAFRCRASLMAKPKVPPTNCPPPPPGAVSWPPSPSRPPPQAPT